MADSEKASAQTNLQRDFKRLCSRFECQTPRAAEVCEEEEHSEAIDTDSQQHRQYLHVEDSQQYLHVDTEDTYSLFRDKYLISNVVNSRPETSRPLHSYKLKVQGTTIIGMLDSGAQINCISQHIVQKHKFPVYLYDTPIKLGMAVEGDKYEITSYTEIPYKIAQYSGKLSIRVTKCFRI